MGDSESNLSFEKCPKFICDKVFGVPRTFLQALLAVRGSLAAGGTFSYSMFCLRISISTFLKKVLRTPKL